MRIALAVAIYKRHDLEKIVLDNFKRQAEKFGFDIIVAGSEGEHSKVIANGCHYIEVENYPVSDKHNSMLPIAKSLNVDGVVVMGSDNIVSDEFWDHIYKQSPEEDSIVGVVDSYVYSTSSKELRHWPGYRSGKQTCGAGRFYSRKLLEKCEWQLWETNRNSGLDSSVNRRIPKEKSFKMDQIGVFLVNVMHTRNITGQAFIENCEPVKFEIMAKKIIKEVVDQVENLEAPKNETKRYEGNRIVEFISNGGSKYLKKGVYKLPAFHAQQLVDKHYGVIEE